MQFQLWIWECGLQNGFSCCFTKETKPDYRFSFNINLITAYPLSYGMKIDPWFWLSFCSEPTPTFLLYLSLHWMPKKSQCTWHEGCTSYIYAPTNVCSILVPTSLKSSVGKDSIKYKTVHATVLLIRNIVHPHCLSIITFLLDFLFKHTQKINIERSMVIFLSE